MILPARLHHSLGNHEDESGICASRPKQRQQSSTSPERLVPAGQNRWPAPANLRIDLCGSTIESPFAYDRYSRFLFSGLDDLHCKRTDSDANQPMDYSSVSFGGLRFSGAAHLHVSDADLYLRHLDRLLPQLTLRPYRSCLSQLRCRIMRPRIERVL